MPTIAEPNLEAIYESCNEILNSRRCVGNSEVEEALHDMVATLIRLEVSTRIIREKGSQFDSRTGVKANGFRSLTRVVGSAVRHCTELCETIKDQISRLGYVGCDVLEDIRTWVTVLERLLDVLDVAVEITGSQDSLFPESPNCKSPEIMKLTKKMEDIDITPFYGSALGFQFRGDSRRMMYPLAVSMASFRVRSGFNCKVFETS